MNAQCRATIVYMPPHRPPELTVVCRSRSRVWFLLHRGQFHASPKAVASASLSTGFCLSAELPASLLKLLAVFRSRSMTSPQSGRAGFRHTTVRSAGVRLSCTPPPPEPGFAEANQRAAPRPPPPAPGPPTTWPSTPACRGPPPPPPPPPPA